MKVKKLANGISYVFEKRKTDAVAVEIQIHVGSNDETPKQAGLTHLIEHMIFEGTKTRSAQDIANTIESVGGEFNAVTTQERTFYYVYIPKEYLSRALEILADMVQNSVFDEATLKKEKNVVINEIQMTDDDPKSYQWIILLKTLFQKHKAKNPVYGNVHAIQKVSRKEVLSYYRKHYIPSKMTISIIGDMKNPLPQVKRLFENIPAGHMAKEQMPEEPLITKPRKKKVKREVDHYYVAIGYHAPARGEKDSYALEVIRSILGRGQSSRLFNEIRTKRGIAYMVGAVYEYQLSFGIFAVYVGTTKEHMPEARKILLDACQLKNLTKKEVEDAKNHLMGSFTLHREDNKERADSNAYWSLMGKSPQEYAKNIKKVSLDEVQRAAKKYFNNNYAEVLICK